MKISNIELEELRVGLVRLREHKAEATSSFAKRAACAIVADRVGHALRQIRDACSALDEATEEIVMRHAVRDREGEIVPIIGPLGQVVGTQIKDIPSYSKERRPLLREEKEIPDLKAITYELLWQAEVPVDGELVQALGAFLDGDPIAVVEAMKLEPAVPAAAQPAAGVPAK